MEEAMFEAVIFDLDDTLLLTGDLENYRGQRNVHVTSDEYRNDLISDAKKRNRVQIGQNDILRIRTEFPDLQIAVFTTSPRFYAKTLLDIFYPGLKWDAIVGYEDVRFTKPHADGIVSIAHKLRVKRMDCILMVGDSWKDIASAYSGGGWALLYTQSWPKNRTVRNNEDYRALKYLPDAIADEPQDILEVMRDRGIVLPLLELIVHRGRLLDGDYIRTPVINHFNKLSGESKDFVRVTTLGRYFTRHPQLATRRQQHEVTSQIDKNKDATTFPSAWIDAILYVIQVELEEHEFKLNRQVIVTSIPSKPDRTPRLERLLTQLSTASLKYPKLWMVDFVNGVLAYKSGAKSHHGLMLDKQQRFENVRDNLYVSSLDASSRELHVVVIDDVVTSGATLYFADRYLREAGAASVTCLALTQTVNIYDKYM